MASKEQEIRPPSVQNPELELAEMIAALENSRTAEYLSIKKDWKKQRDESLASQKQEIQAIKDQLGVLAIQDYSQLFAPLSKVDTLTSHFARFQLAQEALKLDYSKHAESLEDLKKKNLALEESIKAQISQPCNDTQNNMSK